MRCTKLLVVDTHIHQSLNQMMCQNYLEQYNEAPSPMDTTKVVLDKPVILEANCHFGHVETRIHNAKKSFTVVAVHGLTEIASESSCIFFSCFP